MPYIEWWSYRNIVRGGKEELPIEAEIECEIDGYKIKYTVSFSGIGGVFRIIHEDFNIEGFLSLEREGQILKISHNKDFLHQNAGEIEKFKSFTKRFLRKEFEISMADLLEQTISLPADFWNLLYLEILEMPHFESKFNYGVIGIPSFRSLEIRNRLVILPRYKRRPYPHPLRILLADFREALNGFTILRHPNVQAIRTPSPPRETRVLLEDASNLSNILNTWFMEKLKFPDRIEAALSRLFPNTQISTALTPQGEIYIKVHENGVELNPPCIADGFYKVLAILAAIELRPSLLAIDEIENSLHAKVLEYIIDELKSSEVTVVITTHSPVVVDMVDLEDLLIVEKTAEGTTLTPVKEPEKVRKKLAQLHITQSESWLYGELAK
jgi:hypothetical protein